MLADGAGAQVSFDEVPLADILEVMLVDRDLVAIDAQGGGQRSERLLLGESVLWMDSRGAVGVVLTDQRVLAVGVGSASWQEERYLRTESTPRDALLGDRVALVTTASRAIGFSSSSGNLIETRLGVHENVVARRVGENVGVIVTNRRALGLSPLVGGFFGVDLLLKERIESIDARANLVTLATDRRLLIFRSPTGSWEERRRELNP